MLLFNRLFELFFPIWMALVNGCLVFIFARIWKIKEFRSAGLLLAGGAASFLLVNVTYMLINWSGFESMKWVVHLLGVWILIVEIFFSMIGSVLMLLGAIVLVRRVLLYGPRLTS